jgi:hypothetical protein
MTRMMMMMMMMMMMTTTRSILPSTLTWSPAGLPGDAGVTATAPQVIIQLGTQSALHLHHTDRHTGYGSVSKPRHTELANVKKQSMIRGA